MAYSIWFGWGDTQIDPWNNVSLGARISNRLLISSLILKSCNINGAPTPTDYPTEYYTLVGIKKYRLISAVKSSYMCYTKAITNSVANALFPPTRTYVWNDSYNNCCSTWLAGKFQTMSLEISNLVKQYKYFKIISREGWKIQLHLKINFQRWRSLDVAKVSSRI